jgi:hypothetical protein
MTHLPFFIIIILTGFLIFLKGWTQGMVGEKEAICRKLAEMQELTAWDAVCEEPLSTTEPREQPHGT